MKSIKIIASSILACLMGAAVAFGVNNKSDAVKADDEPVNNGTLTTVYFAVASKYAKFHSFQIEVKTDSSQVSGWETFDMERDNFLFQKGVEYPIYKVTYTDKENGVGGMYFNINDKRGLIDYRAQPYANWVDVSEYNGKIYIYDRDNYSGYWTNYDPIEKSFSLKRYALLENGDDWDVELIDENVYPAGYSFDSAKGAPLHGYDFEGWYYDSDQYDHLEGTVYVDYDLEIYGRYRKHDELYCYYIVDLGTSGWSYGSADYAIYFFISDRYEPALAEWSDYVENVPAGQNAVRIYAHHSFMALQYIVVRYNVDNNKAHWENNKWDKVWNKTTDNNLDDSNYTFRISDYSEYDKNFSYAGAPTIKFWYDDSWSNYEILWNGKINSSGHAEFYYDVEFEEDFLISFKMAVAPYNESYDYYNNFQLDESVTGCFELVGGMIQVKVAGIYSFFFDAFNHSLYITRGGIADAEEFSQDFLDFVGCDPTGKSLPSGWSEAESWFNNKNDPAKDILYSADANENGTVIERAIAKYEAAIRSHSDLTRFITDSGGEVRPVSNVQTALVNEVFSNSSVIFVTVALVLTIGLVAGLFIYKRKKEN